jgi:DNA-directed RNA polymerase specialized sigma24 family protein
VVQEDLDILLYAWLSEPDERRAERQFTQYFRAAFPAICRYLRSLHTDPSTAQDLAQQALIKLFNHLGAGRREADGRLSESLSALRPLELGPLHVKQVAAWRRQVGGFRDAAVSFRVSRDPPASRELWKEAREDINGRIPPLTRQAAHFIEDVHAQIGPRLLTLGAQQSGSEEFIGATGDREDAVESTSEQADDAEIKRLLAQVFECARGRSWADADTALGVAGAVGFLSHTGTVRNCLPRLAIPSNGLLYTIAKRQLLDRLRSSKHQSIQSVEHLADHSDDGVLGMIEMGAPDTRVAISEEARSWVSAENHEHLETEVAARYGAFLEFLRAPLTRAEGALAAASTRGKAKAEQARVESLRGKFDRILSVLAALQEDPAPTEEQIARREGLSRNQVKYVIERIREEFAHFFPDLVRTTDGRRRRQGDDSTAGEAVERLARGDDGPD